MSYQDAQTKNQQIQDAINQEIALEYAKQLLAMILAVMPWFAWMGWGNGKTVEETTDSDLEGLTLEQLKEWSAACLANYPQGP